MKSRLPFRRSYVLIFLGLLLLALTILPFSAFLPTPLYWEIKPSLANGEHEAITVGYFVRGSFVNIMLQIDGGDRQIAALLMDPSGNILQQVHVENSSVFGFGIQNDGHYSLRLENDFNLAYENDEQILVQVYYYLYRFSFWILGIIILIFGCTPVIYHKFKPKGPALETFDSAAFDSEYVTFLKLRKPVDVLKAVARTKCIRGLLKWVNDNSVTREDGFRCETDNQANVFKASYTGGRYVSLHFTDENKVEQQAFLSITSLRKLVEKIEKAE